MKGAVFLFPLILGVACTRPAQITLQGHYVSQDEPGVMVFRKDGIFGFDFITKFDFFTEKHLPKNHGRYKIHGNGEVEVLGLPSGQPKFSIQVFDGGSTLVVNRLERNGTLPLKAIYRLDPTEPATPEGIQRIMQSSTTIPPGSPS